VSFTVAGLDPDATATAIFSDGTNSVQVSSIAANGLYAVNLASLTNGVIHSSLAITDGAGNQANVAGNDVVLDTTADANPAATLSVNDTADHIIDSTEAPSVSFAVAGLDSDATAIATFTDGSDRVQVAGIAADGTYSVDLTNLVSGTIHSSLAIADAAGNQANASGNDVTLLLNRAPVASADSATALEAGGVNNATPGSDPSGNVLANDSDPDAGDTLAVQGVAAGALGGPLSSGVATAVSGSYGALLLNADGSYAYTLDNANPAVEALNIGAHLSDVFSYTISDGKGGVSTVPLTVTIDGADDAPSQPTDADATANSVVEGSAFGTSAGITAASTDVDGPALSYQLLNDAGGRFAIDSVTGAVTVANGALIDYESAHAHQIVVQVSDGTLTATQNFTIGVTDANDVAPTITSAVSATEAENTPASSIVYTAAATDPDTVGTIAFSLSGTDAALFSIDSVTGAVRFLASPDFDAPLDANGDNQYLLTLHANDGVHDTAQGVTIAVTNLPGVTIGGGTGADTISGSKTVAGQPFPTGEEDSISGNAGNDSIAALGGNDTLNGGAGADTLAGGAGNDLYIVDNAGDLVVENSGEGTDTVQSSIAYTLGANVENLTLTGAANINATGNAAANVIAGNGGNNIIAGLDGADTIDGGGGTDTATYAASSAGVSVSLLTGLGSGGDAQGDILANIESLIGSAFDDSLQGSSGANSLTGGAGNDTLDGGAGADSLAGGIGNDTYIVDNGSDVVTEAANQGTDTVITILAAYTLGTNVENLTFVGAGSFTGTGNTLNNFIVGGGGNDNLSGLAGNDTLDGGAGADTLSGGAGNDTYVVDNPGDQVSEAASSGTDTVLTTLSALTLAANVENLSYTGSDGFAGTGNTLANLITGGVGADTLSGLDGNDTLDGGAGADILTGGLGNDTYIVDNAGDQVVEASGAGTDTVLTTLSALTLAANVENLTYTGTDDFAGTGNTLANAVTGGAGNDVLSGLAGNDTLTGNDGSDTLLGGGDNDSLVGGNGADSLDGGDGNDTLSGSPGDDTLAGGLGNDTYNIDSAGEVVIEASSAGTDIARVSIGNYTLGANIENLTYTGSGDFAGTGNGLANLITGGAGNDTLDGAAGADKLTGLAGDDQLFGGDGNDTLIAGAGADTQTGGAGADRFMFSAVSDSAGASVDIIADFSHAQSDKIDVSAIDADISQTGNQVFTYMGNAAFDFHPGELRWVVSGGSVVVTADVDGDGVADFTVNVAATSSLVAADFVL